MVVGERGLGLEKPGLGLGMKSYGPQSTSSATKGDIYLNRVILFIIGTSQEFLNSIP